MNEHKVSFDLTAEFDSTEDAIDVKVTHDESGLSASVHVPMSEDDSPEFEQLVEHFMQNLPDIFEAALDKGIAAAKVAVEAAEK